MAYIELFCMIAAGVFWYRAAQMENLSPVAWVAASLLFSVAAMWMFGSVVSMLVSQVLLLVVVTLWRVLRAGAR